MAEIRSELSCYPEPDNDEDRYAVAIMDGTNVVGHVPGKISYICHIFLLHSGSIICRVTGPKQHSRDLVQGRLEVPCEHKFFSKDKCEKIARGLLKIALIAVTDISDVDPVTAIKASLSPSNSKHTTESHAGLIVSSISPLAECTNCTISTLDLGQLLAAPPVSQLPDPLAPLPA